VRESKITARLPHPGIPPVHALGTLADVAALRKRAATPAQKEPLP
jgi:hypothetical protein